MGMNSAPNPSPIIATFVIFHLLHLTTGDAHPSFVPMSVYRNVVIGFSNVWVSGFYILAQLLLGDLQLVDLEQRLGHVRFGSRAGVETSSGDLQRAVGDRQQLGEGRLRFPEVELFGPELVHAAQRLESRL